MLPRPSVQPVSPRAVAIGRVKATGRVGGLPGPGLPGPPDLRAAGFLRPLTQWQLCLSSGKSCSGCLSSTL